MKTNRIFAFVIVAIISLAFAAPPAWAGSKHRRHRHMLQGAAIGLGAFMLGKALHDHVNRPPSARLPYHRYEPEPPPQYGHWEIRRIWVPPTYKRVWNPGHYNRRHHWIPGEWIEIVDRHGYWDERRVWVATN